MKKFQYLTMQISSFAGLNAAHANRNAEFCKLGAEGWELVSVIVVQSTVWAYFKREIQ